MLKRFGPCHSDADKRVANKGQDGQEHVQRPYNVVANVSHLELDFFRKVGHQTTLKRKVSGTV